MKQRFSNLSLQNKLFIGFGLMLFCLLITIIAAYIAVTVTRNTQENLYKIYFPFNLELAKLRSTLNREQVAMTRMVSARTRLEQGQWHQEILTIDEEIEDRLQALHQLSAPIPALQDRQKNLSSIQIAYKQIREEQTIPLIYAGKIEEATTVLTGAQREKYEMMRAQILQISQISEAYTGYLVGYSEWIGDTAIRGVTIIGVFAVVLSIVLLLIMVQTIAGPIKQLAKLTEQVAYGNLSVQTPFLSRVDEVGTLALAFGMMVSSLRMVTQEIRESVNDLMVHAEAIIESVEQSGPGAAEQREAAAESLKEVSQKLEKLVGEYKL